MSKEELFHALADLYEALGAELPVSGAENACGTCRECCTGTGLNLHNVTSLELDFIEDRVGPTKLPSFRRFLQRDGEIAVCPFFDDESWGCGIYPFRPFSCRLFGHYRSQESRLPEVCVFRGQEQIFQTTAYYRAVPQAEALRALVRRYWPYQAARATELRAPGGGGASSEPWGDALEQALFWQAQGELTRALETLAESDLEQTPYVLYCLSLILEGLGLQSEAARALEEALQEAPDCAPLHFRLACNLYGCGRREDAVTHFERTLDLWPEKTEAWALLGAHHLQSGSSEKARSCLLRALELEPSNSTYEKMLAMC